MNLDDDSRNARKDKLDTVAEETVAILSLWVISNGNDHVGLARGVMPHTWQLACVRANISGVYVPISSFKCNQERPDLHNYIH